MQRQHEALLRDKRFDGMKLLKNMDDRYLPIEEHRVGTAKKKFELVSLIFPDNNVEKWGREIMRSHQVILSGGKTPEKMACEEHIESLLTVDNKILQSYVLHWRDAV